jgi:hypothetical protein
MGKHKPRVTIYQLRAELPGGEEPTITLTPQEVIEAGAWYRRAGGNNLRKWVDMNVTRRHNRDGVLIFQKWLNEAPADEVALILEFKKEIDQELAELVNKQHEKYLELEEELINNRDRLHRLRAN